MLQRHRHRRALVTACLAIALLLPAPARALHTDTGHLTDYTAHTRPGGTFEVGLWTFGGSPWDWLMIDTYTWPWLLQVANLSLKARLWADEDWAVAVKVGAQRIDLQKIDEEASPVKFNVLPLEAAVSYRLAPEWEMSAAFVYTPIIQKGSYDAGQFHGAGGYTNSQLTLALEMRLNERWALFVRSRHLLGMQISAKAETTQQVDDYTTVETHASMVTKDLLAMGFPQTLQVVPGIAYSGTSFNFLVGLGYGNLMVPGANIFVPIRWLVPQLDLSWRF